MDEASTPRSPRGLNPVEALGAWSARRLRDRSAVAPAVALATAAFAVIAPVLVVIGLVLVDVDPVADPVGSWDDSLAGWSGVVDGPVARGFLGLLVGLTGAWAATGAVAGATVMLALDRRWPDVAVVVVSATVVVTVHLVVALMVARPLPPEGAAGASLTGSWPAPAPAIAVGVGGALASVVWSRVSSRRVRMAVAWSTAVVALAAGVAGVALGRHHPTDAVGGWVLGAASLVAGAAAGRAVAEHRATDALAPVARRRPSKSRRAVAATTCVAVGVGAWSLVVEPRAVLTVQREVAEVPGLPAGWDGEEIGVLADLQVGMWLDNPAMGRHAVARLVEAAPAAVLVLGDFVYGEGDTDDDVATAVAMVAPLVAAGIPTLAVLGNHDYRSGAAPLLERRLEGIGVRVLHNDAVVLDGPGGRPLYVAGIGSVRAGRADPVEALAAVPDGAARVVMMHNPAAFERIAPGSAPFAVAGHTHGGQLRVPFLPEWSFLRLVEDHEAHADGWIPGYGAPGNHLFVNRGIGMSLLPVRLNCSPAITIFTLRRAS